MKRQSSGIKFVGVLIAAFVFGLVLMVDGSDTSAAQQSNFMGGNPSVENSDDQRLHSVLRLVGHSVPWQMR